VVLYPKLVGLMVLAINQLLLAHEELTDYSRITDINQDE
jgi:hypothetical protein